MKNFLILLLIVLFEVTGNTCLSRGMRLVGDVSVVNLSTLWITATHVLTNLWVIVGVILLIGYFLCFLAALSKLELSYVLPMTAFGYALTVFAAWAFLGETISISRWWGTGLICMGVVFVGLSEQRGNSHSGDGTVR